MTTPTDPTQLAREIVRAALDKHDFENESFNSLSDSLVNELSLTSLLADKQRLDWLEKMMTPANDYCEIYLAGLRSGMNRKGGNQTLEWDADAYQIESNPEKFPITNAKTLRLAIDSAMKGEKG